MTTTTFPAGKLLSAKRIELAIQALAGAANVAKAKPDGYTVLVTTSTVAANMSLYINPGYDFEKKELIAAANIASTPNVILAGSGFKVKGLLDMKDVQEKLAAAGFSIENQSPDNFAKTVKAEIAYW